MTFRRAEWFRFLLVVIGLLPACATPSGQPDNTASGAVIGGATGAVVGGAAAGAPIAGALVGAVAGGIVGHGLDQAQEARLKAQAPQTMTRVEQGEPLTTEDVKAMAKAKIGDDLIISQIRNSRTIYHLKTTDIVALKNAGVSESVIDFMINTPTQAQNYSVAEVTGSAPPAPIYEPVVVAPGPDFIWVGGTWIWHGDRWAWHHGYWHRPIVRPGFHPVPVRVPARVPAFRGRR